MFSQFKLPQYFNGKIKKEIGELYASSAIANFAISMAMFFEPIFLVTVLRFDIPEVLLFFAIVYSFYLIFIPFGARIASLYGYKHAMAISVPFHVLYWVILLLSRENPNLVFVAAISLSLEKSFYWPGFHSLMARYADRRQMGKEYGIMYAIASLANIIGPLVGGVMSEYFSLTATFILAALIYCCSTIPLFSAKELFIPKPYSYRQTWEMFTMFRRKFFGYMGFGEELLVLTIWPIYIFTIVKDLAKSGGLATAAGIVSAVLAIVVGKISDQYTKKVLVKVGAFFSAMVWLFRFAATNVWNTFMLDALSKASKEIDFIPITALAYIKAEDTHVVPYAVFFEQSLSVGKLLACLIGAVLFSLTGSFMVLFVLGALFSILYMLI